MSELKDKIIIVTGAFSGIGKEITKLLIENGATVVGTGRNQKNALKLKKKLKKNILINYLKKKIFLLYLYII